MTYQPFEIEGDDRPRRWLVTCDHATNTVPEAVGGGSLGLTEADMARHIAYDPGAAGVTRALARRLNGPAICSDFSRLVIDPNRGLDDPTLLMRIYDGTIVPGNRYADDAEIARRKALFYDPYHDALTALAARREDTVIVAVHSFTPRLNGRGTRPWEVGVLYGSDARLARPLIAELENAVETPVGDNEPYSGHLPGDAIDRHALKTGRPNALIELRQDVIETPAQQEAWAERLAPLLDAALVTAQL